MKPFAISESDLTQYLKFHGENKTKEDYKPEKNRPGPTQSTLTASACVRLYNISKTHASLCFSTREKTMVVAKNEYRISS